jgi:hypothetical protein
MIPIRRVKEQLYNIINLGLDDNYNHGLIAGLKFVLGFSFKAKNSDINEVLFEELFIAPTSKDWEISQTSTPSTRRFYHE